MSTINRRPGSGGKLSTRVNVVDDYSHPGSVRIALSVSRRALLASLDCGSTATLIAPSADAMRTLISVSPEDPQVTIDLAHGERPRVSLCDCQGRNAVEILMLPAWQCEERGGLLHIYVPGFLEACIKPDDHSARPLYVRSELPAMLGLAGGRYEVC